MSSFWSYFSCAEEGEKLTVVLSLLPSYLFDRVFEPESTQDEVFRETALPLLPGLLDGYNATVFAYGVSGGPTSLLFATNEGKEGSRS